MQENYSALTHSLCNLVQLRTFIRPRTVPRSTSAFFSGEGKNPCHVRQLRSLRPVVLRRSSQWTLYVMGKGSKPRVIPAALSHADAINESIFDAPLEISAARTPLTILIADDNVDAADTIAHLLRYEGHQVDVAYDGPAALQLAKEKPPHVAILDTGMPGMTGYEVARRMKGMPEMKNATLVALTGWGNSEDKARTLEAGFDFHLTKPVEHAALTRILERHPGS